MSSAALVPPQLPTQSVAPLSPALPAGAAVDPSTLLFQKTWWLYFQQELQYVMAIAAAAAQTSSGVIVVDFTLTANLTVAAANSRDPTTLAAGAVMAVFLRQNATGGWTTTWTSPPFRGGPGGLTTVKNTWSLCMFVAQIDPADSTLKWWLMSLLTNQT